MAGVSERTVSVVVHGVVQGVGFRWFVRERARELRVAGWVRNRNDGAVELMARGSTNTIDALLGLMKTGPRGARVDRVEVDELASPGDLPAPFDIRS